MKCLIYTFAEHDFSTTITTQINNYIGITYIKLKYTQM